MADSQIIVYTDGSCSPNPGNGGWAWVEYHITSKSDNSSYIEYHGYGGEGDTTNNAMECRALLEFLKDAPTARRYTILIDSIYTLRWVCDVSHGVLSTARGSPATIGRKLPATAPNIACIRAIHKEMSRHDKAGSVLLFKHVKGHSGDTGNNRADELANRGRVKLL